MTTEERLPTSPSSGPPPSGLPRRTVLHGALAGTAALTVGGSLVRPTPAGAATPPPAPTKVGSLQAPPAYRLIHGADGSSTQVPTGLEVELTVGTGGLPAGTAVSISYDDRLYVATPQPALVRGRELLPVISGRAVAVGAPHAGRLDLRLPELAPGRYVLNAGRLAPAHFPYDLLADPIPVEVQVHEPQGAVTTRVLSHPVAKQGIPWGVQLGAGWQQTFWSGGHYAWYPSLVTAHSTGPGAVPAGSRLRIILDRRVFESVAVTSAVGSTGQKINGLPRRTTAAGRPVATWTAQTAIAAGTRITLLCAVKVAPLTGALDVVEPPLVEFLPPRQLKSPQRLTGQESQTRTDDVYSPATRSMFAPA